MKYLGHYFTRMKPRLCSGGYPLELPPFYEGITNYMYPYTVLSGEYVQDLLNSYLRHVPELRFIVRNEGEPGVFYLLNDMYFEPPTLSELEVSIPESKSDHPFLIILLILSLITIVIAGYAAFT